MEQKGTVYCTIEPNSYGYSFKQGNLGHHEEEDMSKMHWHIIDSQAQVKILLQRVEDFMHSPEYKHCKRLCDPKLSVKEYMYVVVNIKKGWSCLTIDCYW
jgi:hypothetical protein